MVLKATSCSDSVTAGKDTVAVRVPNHKITLSLLEQLDFPLAHQHEFWIYRVLLKPFIHVRVALENKLPMILTVVVVKEIESTIMGLVGEPILYRLGSLAIEDLEAIIGHLKHQGADEKKLTRMLSSLRT
jgi:L-threonylcarbamoyladenylate synthase